VSKTFDQTLIEGYESELSAAEAARGQLAADLLEERAQRREVGEALARVTAERDGWKTTADRLIRESSEHAQRHQALFDASLRERAQLVDERNDWETLARLSAAERDEARAEVVRLGRSLEQWKARCEATWKQRDEDALRLLKNHRELVRLRTIIVELGAGEAAEPEEQIEALRPEDPHAN
jgi:hypothetical protein